MLPQAFLSRMQIQLGTEYEAYRAAMEQPARRALRVNGCKLSPADFLRLADFSLKPTGGAEGSFYFPAEVPIGKLPLHGAGLCYVQEPSAGLPALLMEAGPGMRVLDLCAAPGGKTGQLAAMMGNTGVLVANEIVPNRANVLLGNLERLGVRNAVVTCAGPESLTKALPGWFDAVLADAPCSGEGMFRRDPAAAAEWSQSAVTACALRQRAILETAAKLVRPGGRLVYATCTFAVEEDEERVAGFLSAQPEFSLIEMRKVYPHTGPGEGQFMALFRRAEAGERPSVPPFSFAPVTGESRRLLASFWRETMSLPLPENGAILPDGRVLLPPAGTPALPGVRTLRAGVLLGQVKSGRIEPDHALAMAYPAQAFCSRVEMDENQAARYLHGETIPCDPALSGWLPACWRGYPLGWGKGVAGTLKNHYPKGLRIS